MNKDQLRNLIRRILQATDLHSDAAENLLMGTAAQESSLGEYIRQCGGGPALGIFQMEPATFQDIVDNFLKYNTGLARKVISVSGVNCLKSEYLEYNLALAICMCRLHYYRQREPIPNDLSGWASYWKRYYNTPLGKGTEQEFIKNFKKFVL